jgi:hypothetical protein
MPKMTVSTGIKRYRAAHKFASAILSQSRVGFPDNAEVHLLASQIFVSNIEPSDASAGNTDQDNSREESLRNVYERKDRQS